MSRKKSDRDIQEERSRPAHISWTVTHSATAGTAQVTKSAVAGKRHILQGVSFAASGAAVTGPIRCAIDDGLATKANGAVSDENPFCLILFTQGYDFGANKLVHATMPSGGASVLGEVSAWGYTIEDEESL